MAKRRAKRRAVKGGKKFPKAALYLLGLTGAGVVAYLFLKPKTAMAASSSSSSSSSSTKWLPQPTPPVIVPGPGNVQIVKGSQVKLLATLKARFGGDFVTVPAGTVITVDTLDADGTIWFKYNGQLLSSPVEDYSVAV